MQSSTISGITGDVLQCVTSCSFRDDKLQPHKKEKDSDEHTTHKTESGVKKKLYDEVIIRWKEGQGQMELHVYKDKEEAVLEQGNE